MLLLLFLHFIVVCVYTCDFKKAITTRRTLKEVSQLRRERKPCHEPFSCLTAIVIVSIYPVIKQAPRASRFYLDDSCRSRLEIYY